MRYATRKLSSLFHLIMCKLWLRALVIMCGHGTVVSCVSLQIHVIPWCRGIFEIRDLDPWCSTSGCMITHPFEPLEGYILIQISGFVFQISSVERTDVVAHSAYYICFPATVCTRGVLFRFGIHLHTTARHNCKVFIVPLCDAKLHKRRSPGCLCVVCS